MRKIELLPGVNSSVLGFGCAPILGAVGAKVAARALCCALDCGVTHFDVARSYGYGEAEGFLGRFFKHRRDQVVIASKFGIRATWKAQLLRPLKPLVRTLKDRRQYVGGGAAPAVAEPLPDPDRRDAFHERVPLTAAAMRKSLERSLKALRTDYLDIFFIHEPRGMIERIEELVEAASELKTQGKIRGWGVAFNWQTHDAIAPTFPRFDVLQFNNSPGVGHYAAAKQERAAAANILYSPFRTSQGKTPAEVMRCLRADFPRSVVLCSMFRPEHIMDNAKVADELL
jgi:aryl-alcohol dehydrogenase-like predicted oxidoreductase